MKVFDSLRASGSHLLAIAGAGALFGIGFEVGSKQQDGLVDLLKEQRATSETAQRKSDDELTRVKLELQRTLIAKGSSSAEDSAKLTTVRQSGAASSQPSSPETATVAPETSRSFFGGVIEVTLVGIDFGGDPLRHRPIFTLGMHGKPSTTFSRVDPGFTAKYEGYEVKVLGAETFSASFRVSKLGQ